MLQRMLFERIETRILVGIVMFVGIMILVGWVAINENARMASFTRQFQARSIERGAELFAANCSTCHNSDGRGITGRAPGLNSPHFFGHDFFGQLNAQIASLEAERVSLATELPQANETRVAEIRTRLAEIPEAVAALQEQVTTLEAALQPAVQNGYPSSELLNLQESAGWYDRLLQANWAGTRESYVTTTLVHGRGQNAPVWDGTVMAAWAQEAGGPLRRDQIQDLTNYILNWDRGTDWTIEDALAVNQYARVPGMTGGAGDTELAVSRQLEDRSAANVIAAWEEQGVTGDAARGELIYNSLEPSETGSILGCAGCHEGGTQGPPTAETWNATVNVRLNEPQFAGYTPEEYIVESILHPNAYIVPGWAPVMPANFEDRTSLQDLADIVEYLRTYGE
jgi:mono/diheme cytochrome c family protein